ncbi:Polyketide biosynthesis 3-hydroxy-3-methylglutaryl-ACP synthase PksG [Streptomyces avidinii]
MTRPVGIQALNAYCGTVSLDIQALFEARGFDPARLSNVLMRSKTVALSCEDAVTYAVNAALPLVASLSAKERDSIELLAVGTESGVDHSKSIAAWTHKLLGLNPSCRLVELKQACGSGVAGLHLAAGSVAVSARSDARALVIGTDVPWLIRDTYIEPSQGAGAVAALIGSEPELAVLSPGVSGLHSFDVGDFLRPRPDVHLWDIDLSVMCFIECLREAYADYARRSGSTDFLADFDQLAMHTPFPGMVKGAHRALLRTLGSMSPAQIDDDFARRIGPSLHYPSQVGNIYAATALLALASTCDHEETGSGEPVRVGWFAYGSGCSSEFTQVLLQPGATEILRARKIGPRLAARTRVGVPQYDALSDAAEGAKPGAEKHTVDFAPLRPLLDPVAELQPLLVLKGVDGYRREYAWWGDSE